MKQLPLVLLILFVQEAVALNGLLVKTYQGSYSIVAITILFIIATAIDIAVGFWIGKVVKQRYNTGAVRTFAKKWSGRLYSYVGKRGRKATLLLLGYFNFPYLNAFVASWLDVPFGESFLFIFLGNMILYVTSMLLVLGVTSVVSNPFFEFLAVIGITLLIIIITRLLKGRKI